MTGSNVFALMIAATVVAGALVAAQGPIFARMAVHSGGPLQAALIAFGLGFLVILLLNIVAGSAVPKFEDLRQAPYWTWAGGVIGAVMVLISIVIIPRIGVGAFMSAVICGQLIAALLFDHFGAFDLPAHAITATKLQGAGLMFAGVYLLVFR